MKRLIGKYTAVRDIHHNIANQDDFFTKGKTYDLYGSGVSTWNDTYYLIDNFDNVHYVYDKWLSENFITMPETLDFKEPEYVYKVTLKLLNNKTFIGKFSTHAAALHYIEYSKHDTLVVEHKLERIVK